MSVPLFSPIRRVGACVGLMGLLSGCAPWKVDKSVVPNDADVAAIRQEIQQVQDFQRSVYEVSTFAVDRCQSKTLREPFTLMTLGSVSNAYPKEKIAAYWKAAGLDETFRVFWAADDSPLKVGDQVVELNGDKIENNKTGMGEYPLAKYVTYTIKARAAAYEDGKPYLVKREGDEAAIAVPLKPACRVLVWAMPVFDDSDYSEIPTNAYSAVVMPPNAIRLARSVDELRYLAGLAVYYSASAQASAGQAGNLGILGLGAVAIIAMPLLYPVVSPLAQGLGASVATGGMMMNAAKFSSQLLADMNGNPSAGLELMARLDARKLGATRVLLAADEREELKKFIAENLAPAPRPDASVLADSPAAAPADGRDAQ